MTLSAAERHPAPETVPCAIYGRISQDPDQDEKGVTRQREDCRQLIAQRFGWELFREYVDNDISATKGKPRPEYQRLLRDVDAGLVKVIVVYTTSRLLRTRKERFEAYEKFAVARVRVQPVRGPELNFDSPAGRMLADILSAVDTHETDQSAERISRASQQAAERGDYNGPRPFGYRQVFEINARGKQVFSGMLEIHETEAPEITRAVDRIIGGELPSAVARDWNSRGIKTVQGNRWTVQSLQQMLLGPYLTGMRAKYAPGADRLKVRDKPIAVYKGRWPAILDADRQDVLASVLVGRRNPNRQVTNAKHMLSGTVRCGRCGGSVWSGRANNARSYICPKGHVGRNAAAVERWVEYCVFHWWEPNGAMDAALDLEARARTGDAGASLLAENRADRGLLARLEDKLADELLDKPGYLRERKRISDRIAARDEVLRQQQRQSELDGIPERGEQLRARWLRDGMEFQWRVLAACAEKVVIHAAGKGGHPFDPRAIEVIPGGTLGCLDPADPVLAVPAQAGGLRRGREPRRRVRAWLAANPESEFTARSLSGQLGMTLASVRALIPGLRKDGEIVLTQPWRNVGSFRGDVAEAVYKAAAAER